MNKKLLSMAIAAAMVAPTAAMAEAVLYGKLHMSIDWASVEGVGVAGKKFNGWGLNGGGSLPGASRSNRIGLKGSEDLGNGLKAIYQVEFGIQMTEEDAYGDVTRGSDNNISMRNSFVGLTGDWGTFVVGRNDTPYKTSTGKLDLFADTMADYNGTVGFEDMRVDNAIAYVSPSFSGFQVAVAVNAGGSSTAGAGRNLNANSLAEAYSMAGIYSNGPFYGSLAYEEANEELLMDTVTSLNPHPNFDYSKWRLGLGLMDWNGFTMTGIYEARDYPTKAATDLDLWQLQAGYSFGNSMVKAMYGRGERDAPKGFKDTDYYTWSIAFDHNLSKRTKAYVLYADYTDDKALNQDWDGFSIGMIHNF